MTWVICHIVNFDPRLRDGQLALTVDIKLEQKGISVINKGDVGHEMFFIIRCNE